MRRSRLFAAFVSLTVVGLALATEVDVTEKKKAEETAPAKNQQAPAAAPKQAAATTTTQKPGQPAAGQSVNTLEDIYVADAQTVQALAQQASVETAASTPNAAAPAVPKKPAQPATRK
jgi:hypothetical protein